VTVDALAPGLPRRLIKGTNALPTPLLVGPYVVYVAEADHGTACQPAW
jgi:hypothetical protein